MVQPHGLCTAAPQYIAASLQPRSRAMASSRHPGRIFTDICGDLGKTGEIFTPEQHSLGYGQCGIPRDGKAETRGEGWGRQPGWGQGAWNGAVGACAGRRQFRRIRPDLASLLLPQAVESTHATAPVPVIALAHSWERPSVAVLHDRGELPVRGKIAPISDQHGKYSPSLTAFTQAFQPRQTLDAFVFRRRADPPRKPSRAMGRFGPRRSSGRAPARFAPAYRADLRWLGAACSMRR
jgi:hypothetical protein